MRKRLGVRHVLLGLLLLAILAYLWSVDVVRNLTKKIVQGEKVHACSENTSEQSTKTNPNQLLFISCGGFLD